MQTYKTADNKFYKAQITAKQNIDRQAKKDGVKAEELTYSFTENEKGWTGSAVVIASLLTAIKPSAENEQAKNEQAKNEQAENEQAEAKKINVKRIKASPLAMPMDAPACKKPKRVGPVAIVHGICEANLDAMREGKRKQVIQLCLDAGINPFTARTQYQAYKKKHSI